MVSSVVLALMLSSRISAGCTSAEPPADDIALMAGLARGGIDRIHAFEGSGSKILFSARVFSDSCRSETVGAAYDPETGNFTFRGFSSVIC